jgi:hypothetical protein
MGLPILIFTIFSPAYPQSAKHYGSWQTREYNKLFCQFFDQETKFHIHFTLEARGCSQLSRRLDTCCLMLLEGQLTML